MMPSPDALQDVRAAVLSADRQFQVIDGGKRGGGGPPEGDAENASCPVTAIGHLDGTYYLLDSVGQLRALSARQIGNRHDLVGLFGGNDDWLRAHYPKKAQCKIKGPDGQDTTEERIVDFRINSVAAFLQSECTAAGLFGDHILIRRPGIWAERDGMPVVHCGDQVLIGDRLEPAGTRTGNQIWAAAPPAARPGVPCGPDIGRALQYQLQELWNYRCDGGAIMAMGLLGCAYYGAAIPWRPAGFLIGGAGSGKSSLLTVLRAASPMNFYTNDTSKAGLEQSLDGRAMPSFIDEASDREDQRGARALLDLVLSASGGEGTRGSRGGVDGKARKIEVAGSIIMASISPPDMKAQHLGRFTIIDLERPDEGSDYSTEHKELKEWAQQNGPALWGRALAGWTRYRDGLAIFRRALAAIGCAPREMDQLGALLAGWFILTSDGLPTEQQAAAGVEAVRDFIRDREDVVAQDAPMQMVSHLLSTTVQLQRSTERKSIGELIERILTKKLAVEADGPDFTRGVAAEVLSQHGIRVIRADEPKDKRGRDAPRLALGNGIWFAPNNSMLKELFNGTPFEGNRWVYEVMRLESARRNAKAMRVGQTPPAKCIWVSAEELGFEGDDGNDD
ncbi:ATP-binding protein [Komagataeibacter xylinus]|nr:ATP-binding protein [Komagataeibacter xylinus]